MKGLFTLSEAIYCKKEALGRNYECEIEGIKAELCFPRYPVMDESASDYLSRKSLLPPAIGEKWKRGEDMLYWGCPIMHPEGNCSVELLALSFICEKELVNAYAQILVDAITKWERAFIDYIKLETKQGALRDNNLKRNSCSLEFVEDKQIPVTYTIELYVRFPKSSMFASEKTIENAIAFANSGKELYLEYQMLLSSYDALKNNRNRQAILDACAAMELSLVDQIKNYCQSKGLPEELLLNKYRYLGERFDLLKKIDTNLPNLDYKTLIVAPRNSVMHNKEVYPSDKTTEELITCVEEFLRYFHVAYY